MGVRGNREKGEGGLNKIWKKMGEEESNIEQIFI